MKKSALYYPELDSLRFFAFLLVLVHHAPYGKSIGFWSTLSKYGWVGVDLFLCLSAFLFARLLYVEYQEKGDINVGYFYLRRALRIWPLYFFFIGFTLFLTVHKNDWNPTIIQRALGMFTFTDNFLTAAFGYSGVILYSAHIWTISYEEQFYLFIPWVLRRFYRLKRSTTISILVLATLAGMIIRAFFIYYNIGHFSSIWVLPVTHFESIFGGLIIGLGLLDGYLKKLPNWVPLIFGVTALYQVTRLPNVFEIQWKLMLTYPLIGIGTSLILFAVMQGNLGPLSHLFKNKNLGYLGKISYGLYVFHFVGLELAHNLTNVYISEERLLVYPSTVLLLSLVITIAISMASYQFLERPFLRLKERFTFIKSRPI
jgi:peptidoglycan/LPS O-acetylase OafA/YrhL